MGVGSQGDGVGRERDAGSDGTEAQVRRVAAAQGRSRGGLPAHDHPDGGADRDTDCARRLRPVVQLQHLQHAGPRRRGHRQDRCACLRLEG